MISFPDARQGSSGLPSHLFTSDASSPSKSSSSASSGSASSALPQGSFAPTGTFWHILPRMRQALHIFRHSSGFVFSLSFFMFISLTVSLFPLGMSSNAGVVLEGHADAAWEAMTCICTSRVVHHVILSHVAGTMNPWEK